MPLFEMRIAICDTEFRRFIDSAPLKSDGYLLTTRLWVLLPWRQLVKRAKRGRDVNGSKIKKKPQKEQKRKKKKKCIRNLFFSYPP